MQTSADISGEKRKKIELLEIRRIPDDLMFNIHEYLNTRTQLSQKGPLASFIAFLIGAFRALSGLLPPSVKVKSLSRTLTGVSVLTLRVSVAVLFFSLRYSARIESSTSLATAGAEL